MRLEIRLERPQSKVLQERYEWDVVMMLHICALLFTVSSPIGEARSQLRLFLEGDGESSATASTALESGCCGGRAGRLS